LFKKEDLAAVGLKLTGDVYHNLPPVRLVEHALARKEGELAANGALCVSTGKYTGRSPKDRFVVDSPGIHDEIDWGSVNKPFKEEAYQKLKDRMEAYLQNRDLFVFDGFVGVDPRYRIAIRVVTQFAWSNLFIQGLLCRPTKEELENFEPQFHIICAPGFQADPAIDSTNSEAFIILALEDKRVIIGGTHYAGEMKKSCFALMNYFLPEQGVFPMHCSANVGKDGETALFFGLSGTGKTTLSADPLRHLIGDDEHGWCDDGIFNFEGGCYAKTISLTREGEPQIWDAIRFGAVLENVVLDKETRVPDYDDESLTENTRAGYPLHFIPGYEPSGRGRHPKTVVFLTADAFGVLPPIAKLDRNQASYHFLAGYTSVLAGTERGVTEPQPSFSAAFGSPFLPREPGVYADLLRKKVDETGAQVYLINTGWVGGAYGVGKRMSIPYTRAMVTAALDGSLENVEYEMHEIFRIMMPKTCPNVPDEVMNPKNTWQDKAAYDAAAQNLANMFAKNFATLKGVAPEIAAAGPKASE